MSSYDRITLSLDPDDMTADDVDELVEESEFSSRSEYIRHLIREDADEWPED